MKEKNLNKRLNQETKKLKLAQILLLCLVLVGGVFPACSNTLTQNSSFETKINVFQLPVPNDGLSTQMLKPYDYGRVIERANPRITISVAWVKADSQLIFPTIDDGVSDFFNKIDNHPSGGGNSNDLGLLTPLFKYQDFGCVNNVETTGVRRGLPGDLNAGTPFSVFQGTWIPLIIYHRLIDNTTHREQRMEVLAHIDPAWKTDIPVPLPNGDIKDGVVGTPATGRCIQLANS